jgi:hypothetical protein
VCIICYNISEFLIHFNKYFFNNSLFIFHFKYFIFNFLNNSSVDGLQVFHLYNPWVISAKKIFVGKGEVKSYKDDMTRYNKPDEEYEGIYFYIYIVSSPSLPLHFFLFVPLGKERCKVTKMR